MLAEEKQSINLPFQIRFGIRQKVILALVTVLLIAMGVGSWVTLHEEKSRTLAEIERRGKDISRFVAESLAFSVVGYDYHTIQLLTDKITQTGDISYARVISAKGNTMGESGTLPTNNAEEPGTALFNQPIEFENRKVGTLVLGLETASTIDRLEANTRTLLFRRVLVIVLIAIAEFFALSVLIIRPLRSMSDSLARGLKSDNSMIEELPVTTHDELGHLANQFNSLHEQLNKTNLALQSKIESADKKLIQNNEQLRLQSEELIMINEEFRKLAITDPLTGLYNRRYFERAVKDELALALRHGDKHCVLLIDIDNFKNINDTYGHLEGDRVLQKFADTLKKQLRAADILSRMGGEEFVVLCKRVKEKDVLSIAEKFRKQIEKMSIEIGSDTVHVTACIGVALLPKGPDDTIEEILNEADEALYYCKRTGRNRSQLYNELPGNPESSNWEMPDNVRKFPNTPKDD
ncbi:MAG: diguanylate cyclase [Acidiferrobacterales bacterium]